MPEHLAWVERQFDFSFPVGLWPSVVERLRGTPARLEERVRSRAREVLIRRDGDRWSIQEHAGHLWDLESLWSGRLDDFERGAPELRAADMSNRKTHDAKHNEREISAVLTGFHDERTALLRRLDALDPAAYGRVSRHPRLGTEMRLCDLLYFVAEHDDHHLASITELLRRFDPGR
jgi:uncharacterized damage-inducible protein DinB